MPTGDELLGRTERILHREQDAGVGLERRIVGERRRQRGERDLPVQQLPAQRPDRANSTMVTSRLSTRPCRWSIARRPKSAAPPKAFEAITLPLRSATELMPLSLRTKNSTDV